jgi:lipid A 3-O-deacylase
MVTIMNRGTGALGRLRSNRTAAILSMLLLPSLTGNASCQAQEKAYVLPETQAGRQIMVELQEIGPVERPRQIHTTNLDFLFHMKRFDSQDFKFYGGLTVSRARGNITRRTGSFEAGTRRDEPFDSAATGAGPVLAIRAELGRSGNVSVSLDGSAGVLLYDRDFPAGASRYEFMFRFGPTLSYRLNDRQDLSLTLRGMHVSNGQGFVPHNPEYNAAGVGVQFLAVF